MGGKIMSELLDYSGLYHLLADLVAKRRTNTLLGKTDTNHSVMIGIRDGEIVSLICAGKRGRSAIPVIRKIESLTVRLEDTAGHPSGADLPPTADIISALSPSAYAQDMGQVAASPGGVAPDQQGEGPRLCELLSRYVGPIAPVICSDAIKAAGGLGNQAQRQRVILALAKEIDNEAEADLFIESARKMFGVI
jgi:hypothetical protein